MPLARQRQEWHAERSEVFVRNPLVLAASSVTVIVLIVIGCSAPSPDGDGIVRGRGASSSGTSGSTAELEAGTSSGGTASCATRAKVDDRPACDQCVRAQCCKQVLACDDEPDCDALQKCADACAGDAFCQFGCRGTHESGASALDKVASCATAKCAAECPSSIPDGGDPFADAF